MTLRGTRRRWLATAGGGLAASALGPMAHAITVMSPITFTWPFSTGAHPETRIEWWYVTGTLEYAAAGAASPAPAPASARTPPLGFQVTFFRAATGVAPGAAASSAFAASDILFAHAALSDVNARRHRHDQRVARPGFGIAAAELGNTHVHLRSWRLQRTEGAHSRYTAKVDSDSAGFALDLTLDATQPMLLQGSEGLSQKGATLDHFSYYYSEPHLAVAGRMRVGGSAWQAVRGRAWLDHEWSSTLMPPGAVGWDWIGINLDDGGALTVFRLRRADGSAVWAGGSLRRRADGNVRNFGADEVTFTPRAHWKSPASNARYPVAWQVDTPAGRHRVEALFPEQELGALAGNGAVYWEGVSRLLDADGRTVGHGYLEMTGYAAPLRI